MNIVGKHDDVAVGVLGDIHGHLYVIENKIKGCDLTNVIIFQVGDFGVGFNYNDPILPGKEKKRLKMLNTFLKKRNIFLYVISGNHDNPIFFDGNHNFSNLIFMQHYDVVEINGHKFLGIGGATSVDRKPNIHFKDYRGKSHPGRREGIDWWPNEKIIYDEEKLNEMFEISVVLTHNCPDFVYPPMWHGTSIIKWVEGDPDLKEELPTERALLTKIYNKLNESNPLFWWVYAHYHESHLEFYNQTKFKLLDINEFCEININSQE